MSQPASGTAYREPTGSAKGDGVRISWLTSLREISSEGVAAGASVERGLQEPLRGSLESFLDFLEQEPEPVAGIPVQLAGILVDDDDLRELQKVPPVWNPSRRSAAFAPLRDVGPQLMDRVICHPSSSWASQPDHRPGSLGDWPRRKAEAKQAYEQALLEKLHDLQTDLLIVDSYVRLIGAPLLQGLRLRDGPPGSRILNLHPGVTNPDDPHRLPGRTPTRDAFTRWHQGAVIVDDKRLTPWPEGDDCTIEYEGTTRRARRVSPSAEVGATLHFVDEQIDHGQIAAEARAPISQHAASSESRLRSLLYSLKMKALITGLRRTLRDRRYHEPHKADRLNGLSPSP